jgi:cholera toxin transcriptional activator
MSQMEPVRGYRFGTFEVDRTTGELRRQGIRIKLGAQPLQVLLMLLERPGELLTREEISRELWPDGTFVDYEHGVNSAVNRIREALRDTARSPKFVETLSRRGYRFVAAVERVGEGSVAEVPVVEVERGGGGFLATEAELPKTSHGVVRLLFVGLQVMYVGFYAGALANLAEIEDLFSVLPWARLVLRVMVVTAAVLIPVRAFTVSAVLMRAPEARSKLLRIWPYLLVVDLLWALAPFLLLHHMSFGLAVACTTLLVYSPFAQRALVLMGAGGER